MELGLGLPTMIPGIPGGDLLRWARRTEELGFASLGVLDRLFYEGYEPLVTLAAAAGATSRVRLTTSILIAPYRTEKALLAKQLAGIDRLSGGRLVIGLAAGGRPDDFDANGTPYAGRGKRLDELMEHLRGSWVGEGGLVEGPAWHRPGGPPLIAGGHSPGAMERATRLGDGWIAGGSSAQGYGAMAERFRDTWAAAGRTTEPKLLAIANVALGPGARERAEEYLLHYYAFLGWKAEMAVKAIISDEHQLQDFVAGYRETGCDELILFPCVAEPEQADVIAAAVLSHASAASDQEATQASSTRGTSGEDA